MNPAAPAWDVRRPAESAGLPGLGHASAALINSRVNLGTTAFGGAPPAPSAPHPTLLFNSEVPASGQGTMHASAPWNRVSDPSSTSSGGMGSMGGMLSEPAGAPTNTASRWNSSTVGSGGGGGGGGTAHASGGWVMGSCEPLLLPGNGDGGEGGGGGSSRGRPGRKPHPRPEDLQAQLDALSAQFGRLNAENQFLKSKLKALETIIPWRETCVNFLASMKNANNANNLNSSANAASNPNSSGSEVRQLASTVAGAVGGAPPLGHGGSRTDDASGQLTGAAAATALALAPTLGLSQEIAPGQQQQRRHQTPLVVALCPGPGDDEVPDISPADAEELKRVGVPEFLQFWKKFALQVSLLVAGAEAAGPGSAKAALLERYIVRITIYIDQVTRLSSHCWPHSVHVNVETGQRERQSDDYWITVCKFANLSRQQLEEIEHLWAALDQAVAPVVQERAVLTAQLSSQLRNTTATAASLVSGPTALLDATAALTEVDELAAQLERNVLREQQSHWDVTDFVWLSTLSPVQGARVVAASYPYVPDALAFMHACRQLLRGA